MMSERGTIIDTLNSVAETYSYPAEIDDVINRFVIFLNYVLILYLFYSLYSFSLSFNIR